MRGKLFVFLWGRGFFAGESGCAAIVGDMHCPNCLAGDTKVVDSRLADGGTAVRRRRECLDCAARFTTFERCETAPLMVCKTSGEVQAFNRGKVVSGVRSACTGRDVSDAQVEALAAAVEDEMKLVGSQVSSTQVGLAVLERLRGLDEVAYLRFASVYKNFDAAADFQNELELLSKLGPVQ